MFLSNTTKKVAIMNIKQDVTELVGNTPLIKLNKLSKEFGVEIVAKCEFCNPTSSVKDRAALYMIKEALKKADIDKKTTIIEPTSGNTGIALASICATLDVKLILTMPESMSIERRRILSAFGATLELTPKQEGMKGAINKAIELQKSIPNSIILQQFNNPANPLAHEETTALEILRDTDGEFDYFVAAIGTGGTFSGVSKILKQQDRSIKTIAVEPENSAVLSGEAASPHKIQGIGAGFVPNNVDRSLIDEIIKVSDEEALNMSQTVAKTEGLLVGISAGANIAASIKVAKQYRPKRIVTILPDTGERYLA
jgi:cysteine synthase A